MIGTVGGKTEELATFESDIKAAQKELNDKLAEIETSIIPALRQCYEGEAATDTIDHLQSATDEAQEAVTNVMTNMQTLISTRKEELARLIQANQDAATGF